MISFTKSFVVAEKAKQSVADSDEVFGTSKDSYAEKVTVKGLTYKEMDQMYQANTWVRACIDKITTRVAEVTPLVKMVKTTDLKNNKIPDDTKRNMEILSKLIDTPNPNQESFLEIRKKVTRDVLIHDAAALEKTKVTSTGNDRVPIELYAVAGDSIKLNVDDRGILKNKAYVQVADGKAVATFTKDQMIYLMMNPQSNRIYGFSPLESLIQTVTAELYAGDYNLDFFYNNATPRIAVMMEKTGAGQADPSVRRFRKFWDQELRGKPHRPIIVATEDGNIKIDKVNLTNEEMQFQEYSKWLLAKIMSVYHMQPLVLGLIEVNTGKLNSQEQSKLFKQDAVKPQLTLFSYKFNQGVVFNKNALGFNDVYLDFDLDLVDKQEQARWHESYLRNGVLTINEIRVKGLGLLPVPWGDVPYLQNNLVPFGAGGEAVPPSPEEALVQTPDETAQTPTSLVSRNWIKRFLTKSDKGGWPIGWEGMEPEQRLEILEKLIKLREKELSKRFIIPNNSMLGG